MQPCHKGLLPSCRGGDQEVWKKKREHIFPYLPISLLFTNGSPQTDTRNPRQEEKRGVSEDEEGGSIRCKLPALGATSSHHPIHLLPSLYFAPFCSPCRSPTHCFFLFPERDTLVIPAIINHMRWNDITSLCQVTSLRSNKANRKNKSKERST